MGTNLRLNILLPASLAAGVLPAAARAQRAAPANRAVYLDDQGVVRWRDNRHEISLFGANYVLPTASDYRAAGYLHTDRKKMIDEDMAHFARMGWDGLERSGACSSPLSVSTQTRIIVLIPLPPTSPFRSNR